MASALIFGNTAQLNQDLLSTQRRASRTLSSAGTLRLESEGSCWARVEDSRVGSWLGSCRTTVPWHGCTKSTHKTLPQPTPPSDTLLRRRQHTLAAKRCVCLFTLFSDAITKIITPRHANKPLPSIIQSCKSLFKHQIKQTPKLPDLPSSLSL